MASEEQRDHSLKQKVLRYQRTGEGWEEILRDLSPGIYSYPRRLYGWQDDDLGQFYLFFLPRLKSLLQRFRDHGKPFEHYLNSALFWNLRSYFRLRKKLNSEWSASAWPELWDCEEEEDRGLPSPLPETRQVSRIENDTLRRRFLFLVLRQAGRLNDRQLETAARMAGVQLPWLRKKVRFLMGEVRQRAARFEKLRQRRNRAFYRCRCLEEELSREWEGKKRQQLVRNISRLRRIMRTTMLEMSKVPLSPSHRSIAEALNVPKGTVDTGLRWIKMRGQALYRREDLEYA